MTTDADEEQQEQQEEAYDEEADFTSGFDGGEEQSEEKTAPDNDKSDDEKPDTSEDDEKHELSARLEDQEGGKEKEGEKEEEDKLAQRLRRVEGRIGSINSDLQRVLSAQEELKSAVTAAQDTRAEGEDAPTKKQIQEALESGEKMTALRDEFPEWAEAMEEERHRTIEHLRSEMGGMVSREDAEKLAEERAAAAANHARALARLDARHENWEEEVAKPEFVAWVDEDQERVDLANSDKVSDSIKLLDLWKKQSDNSDNGDTSKNDGQKSERQERNQERLRRSIPATHGRSANHEKTPSEEEDFLAGFEGK